jgi:hypothetical protein
MYYCNKVELGKCSSLPLSGKLWEGPFLQIDTGTIPGVATWACDASCLHIKFNAITLGELSPTSGDGSEQNFVDPNYELFVGGCETGVSKKYFSFLSSNTYEDSREYLNANGNRFLKGFMFPSAVKFTTKEITNKDVDTYINQTCQDSCRELPKLCSAASDSACYVDGQLDKWPDCKDRSISVL